MIGNHRNKTTKRNDPDLVQAFLKKWWVESEKFWLDDCRSWPREEKINKHGCWGKHAHIPENNYWGIILILIKINCITLKIRSKADFKGKSQNIWQQIILFSNTVMQMIYAWLKIWALSGRFSLMHNVQLMITELSAVKYFAICP
jgi:hypothetical protein